MLDRMENLMFDNNAKNNQTNFQIINPVTQAQPTKTVWTNFQKCAVQIKRDPCHILDFFKAETGFEGNFANEGQSMILKKKLKTAQITSYFKQYLEAYVICHQCKSLDTEMNRDNKTRMNIITCQHCGASSNKDKIENHYVHTTKQDRKKAKNMI